MAATTTSERSSAEEVLEANMAMMSTFIEAGYKAQTRGLNIAKVFVEGAGRQQENSRKALAQFSDAGLPWYAPERYNNFISLLVENQNEVLRIGREYIDQLNAAAADGRQTVETIVKQAGKAREASQAIYGEGVNGFRSFVGSMREPTARA